MGNRQIDDVGIKLGIYETSTDSSLSGDLGALKKMEDGRKFRLCMNSTAAVLVPGYAVQGPARVATYDENIPIGTAAIGDTTLAVTVHASYGATVAANDFADGWFVVSAGTGELGHGRKIKSNTEAVVGADTTLTFYDALTDTISADSIGAWVKNPYKKVVLDAGTSKVVGVPVCDVAASTSTVPVYFWAQTSGPCPMISGGALVAGDSVMTNVGTVIAATGTTPSLIGLAMQTCTDTTEGSWIYLNIE